VAGQVQHLEDPVAKVDDIPLAHESGRRRGRTGEVPQVKAGMRHGRDEARTNVVPGALETLDELHRMVRAQQAEVLGRLRKHVGFSFVNDALVEFVY
jgi:hypothetical protein